MFSSVRRALPAVLLSLSAGLFPLLALWKSNLGQIPTGSAVPSLLYTLALVVILFAGGLLLARSAEKAALLSLAGSVFVFSYGHLLNWLGPVVLLGVSLGFLKLFAVWSALFLLALWAILRLRRIPDLTFLLVPTGLLVVYNTAAILGYWIQTRPPSVQPVIDAASKQPSEVVLADGEGRPDIYYIVLDAYARADILQEVIGYDNTDFLAALRSRGFYLPDCAYSNYDGTLVTLASVLNFDMLDPLGVPSDQRGDISTPLVSLIQNNRASQVFRSYGYQFVTGRGYAAFNDIQTSDVYLNYAVDTGTEDDLAEKRFASLYLNTTVFRVLAGLYHNNPEKFPWLPYWLAIDPQAEASLVEARFWYMQNNYMFDVLETIPERPGSYFVYAHINAPHGPYVYRANGSFRFPIDDKTEAERYADAITYVNRRILQVVDTLQRTSSPAPIIILQGDHGIHGMTTGLDKHKILSAYALPGTLAVPPYEKVTPVNNFRLILKNYFDPTVELLPDTLWVNFINQPEAVSASCDLSR